MADDDDAKKARNKEIKELFKESIREFMEEEKEKKRTATPPPPKSGGLFGGLFGD